MTRALVNIIVIATALWVLTVMYVWQSVVARQVAEKTDCEYVYNFHKSGEIICD